MAINIVETIQQNLGLPPLQKIDPDTQEEKKPENISPEDYFGQAAIPTVLTGLYKFSKTEEGNVEILNGSLSGDLINEIFGNTTNEVVEKVASYTGNPDEYTKSKMEVIAREAVKVIRENISKDPTDNNVKKFLVSQRHNILVYLPATLKMGDILNDDSIDDRTNKMEGPVSGFMHTIGEIFGSSGGNEKKEENF